MIINKIVIIKPVGVIKILFLNKKKITKRPEEFFFNIEIQFLNK